MIPTDRPSIERLLWVMARLRDPDGGCPWDLEQDFASIAPYTIEEAYEVADAIARGDLEHLKDELGDLLLQVVYHAQMAKEAGLFDFDEVADGDRRQDGPPPSPRVRHGRGGERPGSRATPGRQIRPRSGQARRELRAATTGSWTTCRWRCLRSCARPSCNGAPRGSASTGRRRGRSWTSSRRRSPRFAPSSKPGASAERLSDEIGDLLFAAVNLARHLDVDGESALRQANAKFERRFRTIEQALRARGRRLEDASLDEMEALWQEAKARER